MKLNINDASKLPELKTALAATNVSPTAIRTLEKALRTGMTFTRSEDLMLLDIPATDMNVVRDAVVFGPRTSVVANIKTVEYRFNPVGDRDNFFGYRETGALAALVAGKVGAKIIFFGKDTTTNTTGDTTGTSDTQTETWNIDILASRLTMKQAGQEQYAKP